MKQNTTSSKVVSLSVRVPELTAQRLKELADANYRPVATELRRLIEEYVERAAHEDMPRAAA